ncbi:MAG: PASTA domain-containing protein [Paludibacter sp.]|nr:PASTA domain-containing protein [Paludibacter sp.]
MDFKRFWKESTAGYITKRILLAILLFVVLSWITLIIIDFYTRHGESVTIPDLQGLYVEEAENILANYDLEALVIDSVYVKDKPLGTIVEQIPAANSSVKKNRSIFLVVNKQQVKMIPLPDVNDVSYRQADALLKSLGLKVSGVVYSPSEFKDLVIDVRYNGVHVAPGTRLPEESSLVLYIGSGLGDSISTVPSLLGMDITGAKNEAISASYIIGAVNYDVAPAGDEAKYRIYKQSPEVGQEMPSGARINVWLTKDPSLIESSINNSEEEEEAFF